MKSQVEGNVKSTDFYHFYKTGITKGIKKQRQPYRLFAYLKMVILYSTVYIFVSGCSDRASSNQQAVTRHIHQSNNYLTQGQFRAANIEARNAIQKNPDNIAGHIALANILNKLGRYKKSIKQLEQLPETAYANSEFLYTLINAYMGRGKYASAAQLLNHKKPVLSQQTSRYQLAEANLNAAQGQLKQATDGYDELLNREPGNIKALLGLIRLKYKQADNDNVDKLIQRANSISPINVDIDFIEAKICIDKQQYEEAEDLLTEAISNLPNADVMTPRKSAFLQLLSTVLTAQGKTTEAIIYTQKIADAFPGAELAQGDFRDAKLMFEKGEFDRAEESLETLVQEYPNFEDASVLLGIIKYRNGDIESAASHFSQTIDAEISHSAITKLAAVTNLRNNQPERVLTMLKAYDWGYEDSNNQSINNSVSNKNRHNDPQILILLGQAAALTNDYAKAEKALKRAIAIDPNIAEAYLVLADLYNSESPANTEQALAILRQGYKSNTHDLSLASGLARQLFFSQRINEAEMFIKQLLKTQNNQAPIDQLAGDFFYSQQKYTQASDYYQRALNTNADDFESAMKLAMIASNTQTYEEQLAAWQTAALINIDSALPLKHMLVNTQTITELNQAEKVILDLAQSHSSGMHYATLAEFYAARGQLDKAQHYLKKLIHSEAESSFIEPVQLAIHYEQARQYISKGNIEAARKSTINGLRLSPRSSPLLILLTELEIQSKNYIEAQKLVDQIRLSNNALGDELQGDLYSAQANYPAAIESYQALWQQQASNTLARKIYNLLSATKNNQQMDFLLEWSEKMPDSIDVLTTQANDYLLSEDYTEAIVFLERIDQLEPDSVINLNNLAWTYQQLGNSEALATAERAYTLAPDHASVIDTYGWILFKHGEIKKAKSLLHKADQLAPNNPTIQSHLSVINDH